MKPTLDDILTTITEHVSFLTVGFVVTGIARSNDLATLVTSPIRRDFPSGNFIYVDIPQQKKIATEIRTGGLASQLLEETLCRCAFRGIGAAVEEGMRKDNGHDLFQSSFRRSLGGCDDRYRAMYEISRLIRNFYSHSVTKTHRLLDRHFKGQAKKLSAPVCLDVPARLGVLPRDFKLTIDFAALRSGTPFSEVIDLAQLYDWATICYVLGFHVRREMHGVEHRGSLWSQKREI